MVTILYETAHVSVPSWVTDLDAFRRWVDMDDFPETGRIWFLKGEVWVDMSREQIYTHGQVKTEITVVVGGLVKAEELGLFLVDGPLLTNVEADISGNPDALFIANETVESGAVRLIEGAEDGYVELEGSPDMVLEVISTSSVHKDDVILRQAYWEAGIREYWLVDAKKTPLRFEILRHTAKGYVAASKKGGWVKSAVFGKAFCLKQRKSALGHPEYILDVR